MHAPPAEPGPAAGSPGPSIRRRAGWRGALAGGWLLAGFLAALAATILVGMIPLPGGHVPPPEVSAAVLTLCVLAAGWFFGRALARIAGVAPGRVWRVARAGAFGYGLAAAAAGAFLGVAEPVLSAVVGRGAAPPMHVVFGVIFSGATAVVALTTGAAIGWAAAGPRAALLMGPAAALSAGAAFAAVDVLLDLLGRRVGAPGAAETATMMTVMGLGVVAAAAAMGAVLARLLVRYGERTAGVNVPAAAVQDDAVPR